MTTQPESAAAPTVFPAVPRPTAPQGEHSSSYLFAAGLLALSVLVSLRARRKKSTLEEVYW